MAQKKKIIALDIGSHSAKVAVAVIEGNDVKISRLESFRLPMGSHNIVDALKPWMEKNGFINTRAVISLAGKDVIFQPFQLVPADPRTPEQAVAMEVIKFNEMASENMIFDFSSFTLGKEDRRILLAIARPSLLDTPLALSGARNLQVEEIVPSPVAVFNALAKYAGANDTATLFIHAGHATTSLSIGINGQLVFARSFSCGGQLFTAAISEKENIPMAQAENAKHASGSLKTGAPHSEPLATAADRWYSELNSCLSIFKSLFPSYKSGLGCAVLTGGTALLNGLPEYLESKLGIKVTVPASSDTSGSKGIPPEYAVCKGLAHSLTSDASTDISLLPEYIRDEIASRRQRPFWYAAAAMAAAILVVSVAGGYLDLNRTKVYLNKRHADLRTREDLAAKIESVRLKNENLKDMATPVGNLLQSTPVMTAIIKTVAENRGASEWITMICDAESYFNPDMYSRNTNPHKTPGKDEAEDAKKKQRTGISSVIIDGFTRNSGLSSVSTLISELTKLDFVEAADLMSDDMLMTLPQDNREEDLNAIRFVIEVKVKQK